MLIGLLIPLALVEIRHGGLVPLNVCLGDVGVDLVHGGGVGPAADFHSDPLWDLQVIGQGGEAVAQAVESHIGQPFSRQQLLEPVAEVIGLERPSAAVAKDKARSW